MTPADLITEKLCTAGCLVAATRHQKCRCMCHGRYHGLVTNADVTTLVSSRQVQPADLSAMPSRRWSA